MVPALLPFPQLQSGCQSHFRGTMGEKVNFSKVPEHTLKHCLSLPYTAFLNSVAGILLIKSITSSLAYVITGYLFDTTNLERAKVSLSGLRGE